MQAIRYCNGVPVQMVVWTCYNYAVDTLL